MRVFYNEALVPDMQRMTGTVEIKSAQGPTLPADRNTRHRPGMHVRTCPGKALEKH